MLNVDNAQSTILSFALPLAPIQRPSLESLGQVLAEDVTSDIDMPPFDKSLVDGFAVRSVDVSDGNAQLAIAGEIIAGTAPWGSERALKAGTAVRIMTGAAIPPGSDSVVMVERTHFESPAEGSSVTIHDERFNPGQNIMRRATELANRQLVIRAGTRLRPAEVGLLAAVGRASAHVIPRANVAIISTGNEIVEADEQPGPGQIRNSNASTLAALVAAAQGNAQYLGIARDTPSDLERLIRVGLESEILLLSGGVSAGELDLVPDVLQRLGAREVFHKVNLKPGKPIWFGVFEKPGPKQDTPRRTLIFGLPGNPVSVVVCFELFVKPAIRQLMGLAPPLPRRIRARLAEDRTWRSDRPTYWPAWLEASDEGWRVRLIAWKGSPDLRGMTDANAFAILPEGDHQMRSGEPLEVLSTDV